MHNPSDLPTYPGEDLAELSPAKLIDIVIENEDRVPRNVIDECASRGDAMTEYLHKLHEDDLLWMDNEELDETGGGMWWLRLHAAMILGLIPTGKAGLLMVQLMRRMSQEDDDNLQDWLASYWPALFRNKPETAIPALRALSEDKNMDWYMRVNAMESVLEAASRQGGEALEQTLAWLAALAADENEDWECRLSAANFMLDFPRPQYRPLLEDLEARQSGWGRHYDRQSIERAYAGPGDTPQWERFANPWKFYEPEAIAKRQQRWREEDEKEKLRSLNGDEEWPDDPYDPAYDNAPYVRSEPKIGRNDPCPCGSGKKYKKCCLNKE